MPADHLSPNFARSALITIDVQRDFLDGGSCPIAGTTAALPMMSRLAKNFRAAQKPIIHMIRIYAADGSNAEPVRRAALQQGAKIVLPGSDGMQLAAELLPAPASTLDAEVLLTGSPQQLGANEWALYKPRWGAFFKTDLEQLLRELNVNTLVFCGCNYPNCPRTSIYEASERDFRLVLASDAISGLYQRGCAELKGIGVALMTVEEIASSF